MKKFLIGVIFIIPIVVVLALNATGAIIQSTTPVNPTDMVVKNSDNEELGKGDVVKVDINTTDEFIIVEILPGITRDKSIEFESDEDAGSGRVRLERIGETDRYRVIPEAVGITKLDIRAKANVNVYKEVTFNVTTDTIENVSIYDDRGNAVGNYLELTSSMRLLADIYPVGALDARSVLWRSYDTSVAVINENGVLTPVGHGTTRISFEARDKDGNFHSRDIGVDTTQCVAKTNNVFTSETIVSTSWVRDNIAINPAETTVVQVDEVTYKLVYSSATGEYVQEIKITPCIIGEFGFYDDVEVVYTANGPYKTGIAYLESGERIESGVTYTSSVPEVMEVSADGTLTPLKAGETTIRATIGDVSVDKVYTVRERPDTFELLLGTADTKLGIQLKRTWGLYWLQKNDDNRYELTNTYRFGIYGDTGAYDVVWSVDNDEYAVFAPTGENNDVDITFLEAAAGHDVTVTATLLVDNRKIENVKRSFKFSFQQKAKSANVYDYDQMKAAIDAYEYDIVMQSDINATGPYHIYSSIYGNGFTFDYTEAVAHKNTHYWRVLSPRNGPLWYINDTYDHYTYGTGDMVLDDIVIKGAASVEEATDTGGMIDFNEFKAPIIIRYCQVYNTTEGLGVSKCDNALIEGCIFGDNYLSSLTFGYREDFEGNIILRNNVFKQTGGPAVQVFCDWVHNGAINKPLKVNFSVEGFMDIYNWKERSEVESIIAKTVLTRVGSDIIPDSLLDTMTDLIGELVMPALNSEAFSNIYYQYGGKEYVNFGIFGIGLMCIAEVDRVNIADSARLQAINLPFRDENGVPLGGLESLELILRPIMEKNNVYNMSISHPCYLVCTDFSAGDPYIEPGDPVPNSRDLYSDLVNGRNA